MESKINNLLDRFIKKMFRLQMWRLMGVLTKVNRSNEYQGDWATVISDWINLPSWFPQIIQSSEFYVARVWNASESRMSQVQGHEPAWMVALCEHGTLCVHTVLCGSGCISSAKVKCLVHILFGYLVSSPSICCRLPGYYLAYLYLLKGKKTPKESKLHLDNLAVSFG